VESLITCPECHQGTAETIPTDSCLYFYECTACHTIMRPKRGDCCVFCSFGTKPCSFKCGENEQLISIIKAMPEKV